MVWEITPEQQKLLMAPKIVVTDLWRQTRIDPKYWHELQELQKEANELFLYTDAYPEGKRDRDLLFIADALPTPFAAALLRARLIRGEALRRMYVRMHPDTKTTETW